MKNLQSVPQRLGTLLTLLILCSGLSVQAQKQQSVDQAPVPQNLTEVYQAIGYPKAAAKANKEGKVLVKILIDKDGGYVKHEFLQNPDPDFTEAIEPHLAGLRFSPAQKDGKAVRFWVTLPFLFKLG